MTCPKCKGHGERESIICLNPGGARRVVAHCGFCGGTGDVTQEQIDVLAFGEQYRDQRILASQSIRERAEQLGVRPSVLSDMEQGRLTPEAKALYERMTLRKGE